MPRFYTGVGSRRAPPSVEGRFKEIVLRLSELDYVARSGAADGPDTWVERYAKESQIFLPWKGFSHHPSTLCEPSLRAYEIAALVHPAWERLSSPARALHARNAHQVLGLDLKTPSDFVVCWTPGAKIVGGTATAIRIAQRHGIPVFNLAEDDDADLFRTERVIDRILAYAHECLGR
jgi:hypothetical protein